MKMKGTSLLCLSLGIFSHASIFAMGASQGSLFNGFYLGAGAGEVMTYGPVNGTTNANNIHFIGGFPTTSVLSLSDAQHGSVHTNSALGVLNFGYGHDFDSFPGLYLAGELFVAFADRSDSISTVNGAADVISNTIPDLVGTLSSQLKSHLNVAEWGVDFRPGYLLSPMTLAYLRFGVGFNQIRVTSNNSLSVAYPLALPVAIPVISNLSSRGTHSVAAFRVGFGGEQFVTKNFALTYDYIYTSYGSATVSSAGPLTSEIATDTRAGSAFVTTNDFSTSAKATLSNQQWYFGLKYYFN